MSRVASQLKRSAIKLDEYQVISNVSQRIGKGWRPVIIAYSQKFDNVNITNSLIQFPWVVEAVWCLLTPKNIQTRKKTIIVRELEFGFGNVRTIHMDKLSNYKSKYYGVSCKNVVTSLS